MVDDLQSILQENVQEASEAIFDESIFEMWQVEDLMVENKRLKTSDTGKTGAINSEVHGNEMQDKAPLKDGHSTQKDLKDLVEAICALSQHEAEAQETVIHLIRECDNLCKRLKESVEDNKRVIGMYENCLQERKELIKQAKDLEASLQNVKEQISLLNEEIEDLKKNMNIKRVLSSRINCLLLKVSRMIS